jgi:hypothetical protein
MEIDFAKSFDENLKAAGVAGGQATIIGELNQMTLRSGKTYNTTPGLKGGNSFVDLAKAAILGAVAYAKMGVDLAKEPAKKLAIAAGKAGTAGAVLYLTHLGFEEALCSPAYAALASAGQALPIMAGVHGQCTAAMANYQAAMLAAAGLVIPTLGLSAIKNMASTVISQETIDAVEAKIKETFQPAAAQGRRGGARKTKASRKARKAYKSRKARKHTRRHTH